MTRFKVFLAIFAALFLFVAYFFISHAYVFIRLTSVLGFFGIITIVLALVVAFFGRIK